MTQSEIYSRSEDIPLSDVQEEISGIITNQTHFEDHSREISRVEDQNTTFLSKEDINISAGRISNTLDPNAENNCLGMLEN